MTGRLLLDENLSPRLAAALSETFPGSVHVRDLQLKGQSDEQIWAVAAERGYTIISKDDDFRGMSLLRGAPPKVIWLVVGNTSTAELLNILLTHTTAIETFITEPVTSLLTIRKPFP
jgi:predicted nuclease of predicted toxin-antitoxin system